MAGVLRAVAAAAGNRWVAVTFVVPVVAALVVSGLQDAAALNLVHVGSGVLWIGAAVYVGAVLGPSLLGFEPQVRGQVMGAIIPKSVALFAGLGTAALVTGVPLAVSQGRFDLADPLMLLAVVAGLALAAAGVYLLRVQVLVFAELSGEGPPDPDRMGALGEKIGKASPVVVTLQLAVLLVMLLLRAPGGL